MVLLQGGLSLLFAGSPLRQAKIWHAISEELQRIDKESVQRAIRGLYRSKLIDFKERGDGTVKMVLSNEGKKKALEFNIDELSIKKPKRWDSRWRIVCFDIPKEEKKLRETFRSSLRRLGFYQLQKSIFIHPYPCSDEIDFLIEVYDAREYVRQMVVVEIDNALHLKQIFRHLLS